MADDQTPATDDLTQALTEMVALRDALQKAIGDACDQEAERIGRPIHPDILCGLLLNEVGTIALRWGMACRWRPNDIEEYHAGLLRRARRGMNAQIAQALQGTRIQTS